MRATGLRAFSRNLIARAVAAPQEYEAFIRRRWGEESGAMILQRAAIGALTSADPMSAIGAADDEFFSAVLEASIVGQLRLREVPFNVRTLTQEASAVGFWVGQSKAIPLSKAAFTGSKLDRKKVASLMVTTVEALESSSPKAEARFDEDLRNALVGVLDRAFLDASNAGIANVMPAAVTNGITPITSTGNPATDIAALIAGFPGDLATAVFATDPTTAAEIALSRDAGGSFAFPDAGPRGGSILGVPLLTSSRSPRSAGIGQLALIDPSGIAGNLEAIEVSISRNTTLEMDDEPDSASDTPTATTQVSMFQVHCIAFKAILHGSWEAQRPSVAVVTGATYPTVVA